jgi:hypothetical protein
LRSFNHPKGGASGQHVCLCAASTAVGACSSLDRQCRLRALLGKHGEHCFTVVTVEPREGSVAFDRGGEPVLFGGRLVGPALEAFGPQATLVGAGQFLHDADPAHRHEIAGKTVTLVARDRQVVDAELQYRIGQLPRRYGQIPCGGGDRVLSGKLARTRNRQPLRLGQRQWQVASKRAVGPGSHGERRGRPRQAPSSSFKDRFAPCLGRRKTKEHVTSR